MNELKLSIQEAQELLLLSQSSVYSWIDKGKLQSQDTPGGKVIVISRKEADEIRNFNLKSRRNKVARQVVQNSLKEAAVEEDSVISAEILETDTPDIRQKTSPDMTLQLSSRIEELAVEAGRFKQLEILRNEEKENVKFWQEKYHELNAELKKKDLEISALKSEIELMKNNSGVRSVLNLFKKH